MNFNKLLLLIQQFYFLNSPEFTEVAPSTPAPFYIQELFFLRQASDLSPYSYHSL